jgi:ribosomal protein S18 acetylase RimI-like enzyme
VQLLHPLGDDPAHTRTDPACTLGGALEEAWQQPFTRMERMPPAHRQTFRRILAAIPVPHVAGRIDEGGATVCCGRAVAEDDLVGLFDLVTDPAQRGRGLARRLIAHLLAWGQAQGARGAYLQVEVQNAPALRLYDRLGFRELYRYWYRVGP